MLPEVLHPAIQFREDLSRNRHLRGICLQIVPQFRDEDQLLGRRKPLHFWKLVENHVRSIALSLRLATLGYGVNGVAESSVFPRQTLVPGERQYSPYSGMGWNPV